MEIFEPDTTEPTVESELVEAATPKTGRPASRRKRQKMARALANGDISAIDRGWLLSQLLELLESRQVHTFTCKHCEEKNWIEGKLRAQDRLKTLELIAKISGYQGREEPEDERKAFADLMADMENESKRSKQSNG